MDEDTGDTPDCFEEFTMPPSPAANPLDGLTAVWDRHFGSMKETVDAAMAGKSADALQYTSRWKTREIHLELRATVRGAQRTQ